MNPYIFAGIAVAAAMVGSEIYVGRRRGEAIYRWRASGSHIALSMGQQLVNVLTLAGFTAIYSAIFEHSRIATFSESSVAAWTGGILLADLAYYAAHRAGHRINFFAASHLVHHQANDFNHISAMRQSWFTRLFMFGAYLPLALIGVPPEMLLVALAVNLVVQFWSHNGAIRRHLGPLEYFLVTPRSHRAHHGTNAPYLDRNFAGAFIIWDRIFGTYQDVDDANPVVIGGPRNPGYVDPVYSQFEYWRRLSRATRKRKGLAAKFALWFAPPEVLDAEVEVLPAPVPGKSASRGEMIGWFVILVAATLVFLVRYDSLSVMETSVVLTLALFSMVMTGRALHAAENSAAG